MADIFQAKKFSMKEQNILNDAKNGMEKYKAIESRIALLELENIRFKTSKNNNEISKLKCKLSELKPDIDDKMHKAGQVIGLFK